MALGKEAGMGGDAVEGSFYNAKAQWALCKQR